MHIEIRFDRQYHRSADSLHRLRLEKLQRTRKIEEN